MPIRPEAPRDIAGIRALVTAAFAEAAHSSRTEAAIVEALRADGALTLSLVAEAEDGLAGHVAFSPVAIDGLASGWHGLGPLGVRQGRGIGQA